MVKRILITPGEPAGIGPDITLAALQQSWQAELIVIADPTLLLKRAKQLHTPIKVMEWDSNSPTRAHEPGLLKILPVELIVNSEPGELNPGNAEYVMRTLTLAASLCKDKKAEGIVTGPVHKSTLIRGGFNFLGHTEFFAQEAGVAQTVMLFVIDQHKVALATTHIPLSQVSTDLTKELLIATLQILHHDLQTRFQIEHPHIFICGLNPHAGEGGYLGREEIDIIEPVLTLLRKESFKLSGPLPADTMFTTQFLQQADAILAMYHDQALPVVKYMGFERAVNVTLGLPFVRTSVDHGTAATLAGTGKADAGSMIKAVELGIELSRSS